MNTSNTTEAWAVISELTNDPNVFDMSLADAIKHLIENNPWKDAIDEELVSFHRNADSYKTPKEALEDVIRMNTDIALYYQNI